MKRESDRLQALQELDILDTPPEQEFDEITLMASEICQAPIALMSLVDKERQWFKSKQGFQASSTPREISFCQHAIQQTHTMVVPNALEDDRFKSNPLVIEKDIRFYAGAPLITKNGFGIGTLCVLDHKPRILSDRQVESLEALSRNIMRIIELKNQNNVLKILTGQIAQREQLLVEAAKMSSLGQMAGGIAHEINNPLTIISLYATKIIEMIQDGKLDVKKAEQYTDKIQETTQRIAKIIRGMRDFCGDGAKDPFQKINIKTLIEDTLSFCHDKKIRMGISFKYVQIDPDIEIECRPVQISQVLLNLLNNSCDALATANPKLIELEVREVGDHVQLQVVDTGCGIPAAAQDKIFDPFFTTKEVGQGIGLGLSISKGIVESHHGTLSFRSSSAGTAFKVLLPKNWPL